tara:strand:+ start:170 stop:274 length:105 start_codon:yes stop_codon:yes gene_type:complete
MSDLEIIGIFFGFLTGLILAPGIILKIKELRDRK